MRILIADDNVALQEILTEVVSDAGHTVETALSIDVALSSIASFRPNLILLDIDMQKGQGLTLLDRMQSSAPPINIPVVIIRSRNRQVPQDNSLIKGCVDKPFTAHDLMESIDALQADGTEPGEISVTTIKPSEPGLRGPKATLAERGLQFGRSYVLFQSSQDAVNDLISTFDKEGCNVLIVTTGKKKTMIETFRNSNIKVLTLKIKMLGSHFNIYGLGTMIEDVGEFIKTSGRPVVVFNDPNKIIDRNGMNSALTAIHQLISKKYDKDKTFIVSVDPKGFTVKDKD
ncbi:MAG: response regulator, partial [Methanomassiliicoccaceae archaeon]|nr:response regulator [Methanomassiliicoccaceae archaeon]